MHSVYTSHPLKQGRGLEAAATLDVFPRDQAGKVHGGSGAG